MRIIKIKIVKNFITNRIIKGFLRLIVKINRGIKNVAIKILNLAKVQIKKIYKKKL